MKVLFVAWSVNDPNISELCNNLTGGAILIRNICEYVGRLCESYLLIGAKPLKSGKYQNIFYISNGLDSFSALDKNLRMKIILEAFRNALKEIKPDIVNFHGTGDFIRNCIEICKNNNFKFVLTCHLYVGLNQQIANYEINKKYSKDIFSMSGNKYIVVGTGMKEKILKDFSHIRKENIHVIVNGTDYIAVNTGNLIKKNLGIENKKVLILAGTINARKNQIQVVEAYKLLSDDLKDKIAVVFCGKDAINGQLQATIIESGYEEVLHYIGAIPATEMYKYYSIADGYIMPSLAEGLSIASLEALRYGIPQIMFKDSECAEDLSDPKVSILVEERSNMALSKAIEKWYYTSWNTEYIKEYSEYFSMERVANDYLEYYKKM